MILICAALHSYIAARKKNRHRLFLLHTESRVSPADSGGDDPAIPELKTKITRPRSARGAKIAASPPSSAGNTDGPDKIPELPELKSKRMRTTLPELKSKRMRPRSAKPLEVVNNPDPVKLLAGDDLLTRGVESRRLEVGGLNGSLNALRGMQQRQTPDETDILEDDVCDLTDTTVGAEGGRDSLSGAVVRKGSIRSVSSLHHVWGSTTMAGDLQVEERVH